MRIILLLFLLSSNINADQIELTLEQSKFIAEKIWQNEGRGLDKYLVHWNNGEDFASVGIGHFIWFPERHSERFKEAFPLLLAFMVGTDAKLPLWLNAKTDLPWASKTEFYQAKKTNSKKYKELFNFLKSTKPYQAAYMAAQVNLVLPKMLAVISTEEKQKLITNNFYKVMKNEDGSMNERGLYILIDYLNFKGDGTLKAESYQDEGWGLLQVLESLDPTTPNIYKAFSISAKAMLSRRIKNSPPERGEERWREGWFKRLDTY